MSLKRILAVSTLVFASVASSSFAGPASIFHPGLRQALKNAPADSSFTVRNVALGRQTLDTIELKSFQVWASDARITVFGLTGEQTILAPPDVKYFKGHVVGESASAIFFSMSKDGTIRGIVMIGDRRWNVGSGVPRKGNWRDSIKSNSAVMDTETPILISEIEALDELNDQSADWECDLLEARPSHVANPISGPSARALKPRIDAGDVSGATYQLRIAFETDNEFCAAFSNDATSIATYIGDLVGKANIVYERDLNTTIVAGDTNVRNGGAGTDPWDTTTGGGTFPALAEFGTYWHNNYSSGYPDPDGGGPGTAGGGILIARSSAVFLSGRLFSAGVAWFDVLCGDNFFCGTTGGSCGSASFANSYGGSYAFNGSSSSVTTTVPDPEATVNGVQYGLPTTTNFWMLLEVLHELGHNVGGPHTQCVGLTAEEKTLYSTTRNFVDECYNRDGDGCYGGTTANCNLIAFGSPGADAYCDAPAEKGTVMSYCHNIFSSGLRQSRYLFGQAGEPSAKVLTLFKTELEEATPNATISPGQVEPVACSSGRTASVPTCSGCTYSWQITGGSITSSTTGSSVTYTPAESSVTLTATILTSRGCGITASRTITTSCVALLPPTNVTANAQSASSVTISWTASAGASSYNVYRSTNNSAFTLAGSTASTSFNDGGRSANTAYMYNVRAVNGGESADSDKDFATTVVFTDDPLVVNSTSIKSAHVTELRTAVNALRMLNGGQSAFGFTDPALDSTVLVKAVHLTELQTQLNIVRTALGFPTITFTETPSADTPIEKLHIDELRPGVQ